MDYKLKKWIRWLDLIHKDLVHLKINQNIFWETQKIIKNNAKIQKPSTFNHYLGVTYVAYITIGIRRQIKNNQQSISFRRLLEEILANPAILSRSYYKSLYTVLLDEQLADEKFNDFCGKNRDYISPEMVSDDLKKLIKEASKVEDFTDKRIAHHDTSEPIFPLTFQELDNCLEKLDKLYCKYHLVFHAGSMETIMPVYTYDWKEIFTEPWIAKDKQTGKNSIEI